MIETLYEDEFGNTVQFHIQEILENELPQERGLLFDYHNILLKKSLILITQYVPIGREVHEVPFQFFASVVLGFLEIQ